MIAPRLFGPYGDPTSGPVSRYRAYGANAVWFHGFNAAAFEACDVHGLAPCVEFRTFRADFDAHPELVPTGVDGRPIRYGRLVQGVCLSQADFLAERADALLAGVRAYRPAGIWLDYLTYAGWFETPAPDLQESCFCPDCIADFCEAAGIDATTPQQILTHHAAAWTRHKCDRVAAFACAYADTIRAHLPDCIVGAYMCPWTPDEFDGALRRIFAQDYDLLAPAIDVFTPLIYAHKSGRPAGWGRDFLAQAPAFVPKGRKVQLILDILDFPDSLTAVAEADLSSYGIQIFGGAALFEDLSKAEIFRAAVTHMQSLSASC